MDEEFLQLVRLGIGTESVLDNKLHVPIDWDEVEALAVKQGLLGVVLDGTQRLTDGAETFPYKKRLEWLGKVMLEEERYAAYRKAIGELATFYNANGYKMMLLKGYTCGRDWPKPKHRPYGDIDIWLFGKQKEADSVMAKKTEIKINSSHHHHTVFNWHGFTVENHYDFVNIHHHKSSVGLEKIFKRLGQDDSHSLELMGERIYMPSANLHALFLIKHLASHFASEYVTIRQLLDWAFFVEKHGNGVDWKWLVGVLEKYNMLVFFDCINSICVEKLGFDCFDAYGLQNKDVDAEQKQRVLADIISPEFTATEPKHVWKRIPFKYRRWKSNEWKHQLCYSESMSSAFISGMWNHILKPSSI